MCLSLPAHKLGKHISQVSFWFQGPGQWGCQAGDAWQKVREGHTYFLLVLGSPHQSRRGRHISIATAAAANERNRSRHTERKKGGIKRT